MQEYGPDTSKGFNLICVIIPSDVEVFPRASEENITRGTTSMVNVVLAGSGKAGFTYMPSGNLPSMLGGPLIVTDAFSHTVGKNKIFGTRTDFGIQVKVVEQ